MTTIAWDGKTLAADKQATSGGLAHSTTKIFAHSTGLYGITGHLAHGLAVLKWITEQFGDPKTYPVNPSNDEYGYVMRINNAGEIWCYEGYPIPALMEDKFFAIGSGREYATAAMHCGSSAVEAVQIASIYNPGTGMGIDSFTLERT